MELMDLVFALLGHVLASVLYVVRRIKFGSSDNKAVIDRTSILEHKEEIIELWEKKMMDSDQPLDNCKKEEEEEEKLQNGNVHKVTTGSDQGPKDINENISEDKPLENKTDEKKLLEITPTVRDELNNETEQQQQQQETLCVERESKEIEESNVRQTETQQLETEQVITTTVEETTVEVTTVVTETQVTTVESEEVHDDFEEIERRIEAEEALAVDAEITEKTMNGNEEGLQSRPEMEEDDDIPDHVDSPDSLETIEIPDGSGDFEHYTIIDNRPKSNDEQDFYYSEENSLRAESSEEKNVSQNGDTDEKTFDDHFVLDTREVISPMDDEDKKETVGKKSGIHTLGVQKTEQPYSTCTTETKIAMEIREMREREEELKVMRERQAQLSPIPPPQQQQQQQKTIVPNKNIVLQQKTPVYTNHKAICTPGYRVSSVFGSRAATHPPKEENKFLKIVQKETAVEKEIRLAKEREEELRNEKGLPPREDDSYVKPSEVKSSQTKAFNRMVSSENSRLLATAKIQHEIQEQTLRELALRESGHIQTLSSERTDAKVTKLKTLDMPSPDCISPTFHNNNGYSNGTNGCMSPDSIGSKRSTPSPTGLNYGASQGRSSTTTTTTNGTISMHKFISSRGKEATFGAPRAPQKTESSPAPEPGKLKRTVSVESKIQQEILEMKLREEELKLLHSSGENNHENGYNDDAKSPVEYNQNGSGEDMEKMSPRRNNLIAQWEQRIQNSEGKV